MKRIYNAFLRFLFSLPIISEKLKLQIFERLRIHRRKANYSSVTLTKEENQEIKNYWKSISGKRISTKWHRYYQSYTGTFDKQYFPEILFTTKVAFRLYDFHFARMLNDKNLMYSLFANDVCCPKRYGMVVRGLCLDQDGHTVSYDDFVVGLKNIGPSVIKKSIDTSSGKDVIICDFENGVDRISNRSLEDILRRMGQNLTVQERVPQNDELNTLYPHCLNTFRVITYIAHDTIFCAPIALRMGTNGNIVDNIHSGGIGIGVLHDGTLRSTAFSEYGKAFTEHPDTHTVFDGYRISFVEKIVQTAKRLHSKIPHVHMVSWDFSVNQDGQVVLIELNLTGQTTGFVQRVNGCSIFGENTPYMAALIQSHKKR